MSGEKTSEIVLLRNLRDNSASVCNEENVPSHAVKTPRLIQGVKEYVVGEVSAIKHHLRMCDEEYF